MRIEPVAFVGAIALGVTFLMSSMSKLRHPRAFVLDVLDYRILPPRLARAYGRLLPAAEFVCGLALVAGVWPPGTGVLAGALLMSFLVAVAINLARGRTMDCHCFGSHSSEPLGWTTVVRLCVLLGCAIVAAGWRGRAPLSPLPVDPLPALLVAVGLVIGLYLLGTAPAVWQVWHTTAVPETTRRVSLRGLPLERRLAPSPLIQVETRDRR